MNKIYISCFFLLFAITNKLHAANEFYVKGAGATATATVFNNGGLIFVNGEINNNDGLVTNAAGTIELTGNWNNTSTNNKYQSNGTERFYGTAQQTISGTMNGTTTAGSYNVNQFNILKVYRNSTVTATPAKYITLATNVNVANTIDFELATPNTTIAGTGANQAVIRTDPTSPSNVGNYANELYLLNPSTGALTHYATISGNGTVKYIEGKLRRQVNDAATYDFPIGFAPGTKDGMEGFSLKFNSAPTSKSILGHIQNPTLTSIPPSRNVVCDVGTDPGAGQQPFGGCVGGPDGILDLYVLDNALDLPNEWVAAASDNVGTINYDATFYPGSVLDDLSRYFVIPSLCSSPYQTKLLRVMAKDGQIGGTSANYPYHGFPWAHINSFVWCDFTAAGTQAIGLTAQTSFSILPSFSKFRIHGTPLAGITALPVELTSFTLTPVNNEFFLLNWQTASEFSNAGYHVQRSTDGATFQDIGWIAGNGTTNHVNNYTFSDKNVEANITYYYRLKQIDIDQTYKYTNVLSGQLIGNKFDILSVSPNPTPGNLIANIFTPAANAVHLSVYDIVGKEVKKVNADLQKGKNSLNIDISDLAAATYLFRFTLNDNVVTKKIVKN